MSTSTDKQNQPGFIAENTQENNGENKQVSKSGKSNSELMAEFFSVNSDVEKK